MSVAKTNLRAVLALRKSRGWTYIKEVMEKEIVTAALNLGGAGTHMPESEMHYRRGAIFAAKQLMEMPDKLVLHLESEAALEDLNESEDALASIDEKFPLRPEEEN